MRKADFAVSNLIRHKTGCQAPVDGWKPEIYFRFRNWRYEPRHEKTNILVSDVVRHKPGCTATEDGYRLEILDLESRGIVLSM